MSMNSQSCIFQSDKHLNIFVVAVIQFRRNGHCTCRRLRRNSKTYSSPPWVAADSLPTVLSYMQLGASRNFLHIVPHLVRLSSSKRSVFFTPRDWTRKREKGAGSSQGARCTCGCSHLMLFRTWRFVGIIYDCRFPFSSTVRNFSKGRVSSAHPSEMYSPEPTKSWVAYQDIDGALHALPGATNIALCVLQPDQCSGTANRQ